MQWIREKFGAAIVSVIVGLIALVFIFYGVFSPKATRGLHEGAVAGTVNGDPISVREYQQSLNQRLEFFRNMAGGKISDEQLRAFHIQESVFRELVQRHLLIQEARKQGLEASDEEVKQAILEIPAFQKDGKFSLLAYKQMIEASPYGSTGTFERLVRDDLSAQRWSDYFKRRVQVSDEQAKREYLISRDKRNVKYVTLNGETGSKGIEIKPEEVQKYLADPAKLSVVKAQFEGKKTTQFKGKTFDQVKDTIAREMLASERYTEAQKVNEKLAAEILPLLKGDKGSDAKIDALLKPYGTSVKSTGLFNRESQYIPGLGEAKELVGDAFSAKSPIDPKEGGKAKIYITPSATIIAVMTESQHADPSKFEADREEIIRQISTKEQRALYDAWIQKLMEKAKVDVNQDVVRSSDSSSES